jgi:hypothetical protein
LIILLQLIEIHCFFQLLYRCGQETGCCQHLIEICAQIESEEMEKVFNIRDQKWKTVVNKMQNHTKCGRLHQQTVQ